MDLNQTTEHKHLTQFSNSFQSFPSVQCSTKPKLSSWEEDVDVAYSRVPANVADTTLKQRDVDIWPTQA